MTDLRCQKIALIKALVMQMMQNIYILMASCEINDATFIVDSARADGYKRGADSNGNDIEAKQNEASILRHFLYRSETNQLILKL